MLARRVKPLRAFVTCLLGGALLMSAPAIYAGAADSNSAVVATKRLRRVQSGAVEVVQPRERVQRRARVRTTSARGGLESGTRAVSTARATRAVREARATQRRFKLRRRLKARRLEARRRENRSVAATGGGCARRVSPGGSIQAAINSAAGGATICLAPGRWGVRTPIVPKAGQKLIGAGRGATFLTGAGASMIINAKGRHNVTISGMSISGARGGYGCRPACGRGIGAGAYMRVSNVRVFNNDLMGIAGSGLGMVITTSEIHNNGSPNLVNCCAGGVKTAHAYTITNSYVHDNIGIGIWCDVRCLCGRWHVYNNVVKGNLVGGIRYETSAVGATIRGNTVQGNNRKGQGGHGGIEVNSSRNVLVEANRLGGNVGPGIIVNGSRPPGTANVMVRNNALAGDGIAGCGGRVACVGNH
jgi:hypothetical protein